MLAFKTVLQPEVAVGLSSVHPRPSSRLCFSLKSRSASALCTHAQGGASAWSRGRPQLCVPAPEQAVLQPEVAAPVGLSSVYTRPSLCFSLKSRSASAVALKAVLQPEVAMEATFALQLLQRVHRVRQVQFAVSRVSFPPRRGELARGRRRGARAARSRESGCIVHSLAVSTRAHRTCILIGNSSTGILVHVYTCTSSVSHFSQNLKCKMGSGCIEI
jgi:hypothetical protein